MRKLGKAWVHRQLSGHGLTAESNVVHFALRASLKSVIVANVVMSVLHVALSEVGMLPYPLVQALQVGFTVTTLATFSITFMFAYPIGNAIRDISISRDAFARLSSIDQLSGLLNRRAFFDSIKKYEGDAVFVLFDIDDFKAVNDTYGHAVGDEAIQGVGRALLAAFAVTGAEIARLGGEEFSVVLRKGPDNHHLRFVEEARASISELHVGPSSAQVTISAGIAEISPEREIMQIYSAADKALYVAKTCGRNRTVHENDVAILMQTSPEATVQRQGHWRVRSAAV